MRKGRAGVLSQPLGTRPRCGRRVTVIKSSTDLVVFCGTTVWRRTSCSSVAAWERRPQSSFLRRVALRRAARAPRFPPCRGWARSLCLCSREVALPRSGTVSAMCVVDPLQALLRALYRAVQHAVEDLCERVAALAAAERPLDPVQQGGRGGMHVAAVPGDAVRTPWYCNRSGRQPRQVPLQYQVIRSCDEGRIPCAEVRPSVCPEPRDDRNRPGGKGVTDVASYGSAATERYGGQCT